MNDQIMEALQGAPSNCNDTEGLWEDCVVLDRAQLEEVSIQAPDLIFSSGI